MSSEQSVTGDSELDVRLADALTVIRREAAANHAAGTVLEPTLRAVRESGLLMCAAPREYGGWGLGVVNRRPLEYWRVVRSVARADTSFAQNFSVHSNQVETLNALGSPAQKKWAFEEVQGGSLLGAWASERDASGCTVTRSTDGFLINGTKGFCTNAGLGKMSLLYSPPADAKDGLNELLILPIDMNDTGVSIEREWWDRSLAMRATASHRVRFHNVHVPSGRVIGEPGAWPRGGHNIRALCGFASNFLGTIEALFDAARRAVTERRRTADPNVIQRIAEMQKAVVLLDALQRRTAEAYLLNVTSDARFLSTLFRWAAGDELVKAIVNATNLYGSMTLFLGNEIGQRVLDAQMLVRHESNDRHADVVGRSVLSEDFDFKLRGIDWTDRPPST